MLLEAPEVEESFVDDVVEEPQSTPTTPPPATEKPEEWKTAIAELARAQQSSAAPKASETKAPTQDEINEFWGVYNPEKANPEFFKKWLRVPADMDPTEAQALIAERKALFGEMQQGLMRQAVTASRHLLQQELQKLRSEFAPIQESVSEQKAEKLRSAFNESYPVLADPKYAKILRINATALADRDFPDAATYFKTLAESVAEDVKGFDPTFDLGASVTKTKPAVTSPRVPRTSVGGTGGSGGGRATAPVKSSDDDSGDLEWMK